MKFRFPIFILLSLFTLRLYADLPKAENGVINLRSLNRTVNKKVKLNGEWIFVPQQFIMSEPGSKGREYRVKVPEAWDNLTDISEIKDGKGYGSYRLKILSEKGQYATIVINDVGSAYNVWANGKLMEKVGVTGKSQEECIPAYQTAHVHLPADTNQIDLVIEVANFHQQMGGLRTHINYMADQQFRLSQERETLMRYFCLGIFFIIGFYHLGLFIMNHEDRPSFNFGFFCLDIFVFLVLRGRVIHFFYEDVNWEWANKIEYITLFMSLPFFYNFYYRSFPQQFRRLFYSLAIFISILLVGITLFTSTDLLAGFSSSFTQLCFSTLWLY